MRYALTVGAVGLAAVIVSAQSPGFEVISIKPSDPTQVRNTVDDDDPCSAALPRLTGRTLTGMTTVYALIALAYNPWKQPAGGCALASRANLILEVPEWAKKERFDLQALLPEGAETAAYTRLLTTGEASELQQMLQRLLAERFNLNLRREMRELPVFELQTAESAKEVRTRLARSATTGQAPPTSLGEGVFSSYPRGANDRQYASIRFVKQPMIRLAQRLATVVERPVVNRTALDGAFDFVLEYDESSAVRPALVTAVREQLGLRLEPSRAPVEVLVVQSLQRPTPD